MEQILYSSIILHGKNRAKQFLSCMHLRPIPMEFTQRSIKFICIFGSVDESTLINLLGLCKHIRYLSLAVNTEAFIEDPLCLLHALDALPLKSLSIVMDVNCITAIQQCNVFHDFTHLDINNELLITEPYTGLEDFQSLTHIIVDLVMGN